MLGEMAAAPTPEHYLVLGKSPPAGSGSLTHGTVPGRGSPSCAWNPREPNAQGWAWSLCVHHEQWVFS